MDILQISITFICVLILTILMGVLIIPVLKKLKAGQTVRGDGPGTHLKKTGTPTMGGFIFLFPVILSSLFYSLKYPDIIPIVIITAGYGLTGFLDDYIKVRKKSKDGLSPSQKTLLLFTISLLFSMYVVIFSDVKTDIIIPFMGVDSSVSIPIWVFVPFTVIFMYLCTNAVNFTDGVDGLASSVTFIVLMFFAVVSYSKTEWEYAGMYSLILAAGCAGFLVFNIYPAKVFMGDTGSIALGGAVGGIAVLMGMPWIIIIVGCIYALEALSSFIQVIWFKRTGKRVFKMAPIHHHFELSGWSEARVVAVFSLITFIAAIIGVLSLRINILKL